MPSGKKESRIVLGCDSFQPYDTCIITGMGRVGKTLLGNILSTVENVEYAEEPWLLQFLPIIQQLGNMNKELARQMFRTFSGELFKDAYLLRSANFRPGDLSYVGHKKTAEEITFRLNSVHTLADIIETKERKLFMINLSGSSYALDFLYEAFPLGKIVYVTRHPYSIAEEILRKGWFSDAMLVNPTMMSAFIEYHDHGRKLFLPWWIPQGKEAFFLTLSDFDRGIYHWVVMEERMKSFDIHGDTLITVKYEDLTVHPDKVVDSVLQFLNLKKRDLTVDRIKQIRSHDIPHLQIANPILHAECEKCIMNSGYGYLL